MKKRVLHLFPILAFLLAVVAFVVHPAVLYAFQSECVQVEEDAYAGYSRVYNKTFDVNVYVREGITISEEELTHFLHGLSPSERKGLRIEEMINHDNALDHNQQNAIPPLTKTRDNHFHYSRFITSNAYVKNKKFLISVAKGMLASLDSPVSVSSDVAVSASVEAGYLSFVKNKLRAEYGQGISREIDTQYVFSGPPEGTNYNSRSYYLAVIHDLGYYKVWKWKTDKKVVNFVAPKLSIIFSVDEKVS